MRKYIIKRLFGSLPTLFFIIIVNFFLFRLMPGDPIKLLVRSSRLPASMVSFLEKLYGLDKPLLVQFFVYIKNLLTFNFGISFKYQAAVTPLLLNRMWNSMLLLLASTVLAIVVGILLGLIAGWFRGKLVDIFLLASSLFFWSMPTFWIAIVFAALFVGILPISGMRNLNLYNPSFFTSLFDLGKHIILPTIVMTIVCIAENLIIARNEITNILTQDYITTAKAKGLKPLQIVFRHVLRNASLPLISSASLYFAFLVGGALQAEIIFSWPGIGRLLYNSALSRDYPVLQGAFYLLSLSVIIANILTDIAYKYIDPRVEY